jgi:predicted ATPase
VLTLHESIRKWRFYDQFRTDADAPARSPRIGTHTPVLGNDGADVAAIQTAIEIGDARALAAAVEDAFPGNCLSVETNSGRFALQVEQQGRAAELSDSTLQYLLWIAALLTPRPPALMVLNEPETSLHPDLPPPLARLIAQAAKRSQLVVVTHSPRLIEALLEHPGCHFIPFRSKRNSGKQRFPA